MQPDVCRTRVGDRAALCARDAEVTKVAQSVKRRRLACVWISSSSRVLRPLIVPE